jgi:RNA polymerase sigma-70 factor (sigma-E family)
MSVDDCEAPTETLDRRPPSERVLAVPTFEQYYLRHRDSLIRLAATMVDRADVAEDLVHDVFARVLLRWETLDHPDAYVRRALVNACRNELRRRAVRRRIRPDSLMDSTLGADELTDALRALTPRQRTAVVLRYYADLSELEIAHAMGCRPGTVKSLLARGLDHLRATIDR